MRAPLPGTWFSRAIPQSPGYARALARSWRCNCNGWKRYPSCETRDADSALKYAVVSGGLLLPTTVTDLIAAYRSSLASDPTNPRIGRAARWEFASTRREPDLAHAMAKPKFVSVERCL